MGVTVTMGSKGVSAISVNGGVNLILQANAPPQLLAARTIDRAGAARNEPTAALSLTVSGNVVVAVYPWGVVQTRYTGGPSLAIAVLVENTSPDRTIDHLWMFPLGLAFPSAAINYNPSYCATFNLDAPSSLWWDFGPDGTCDLVNDDVVKPLCTAWYKVTSSTMAKQYVSLCVDSERTVSSNWPPTRRPIPPGVIDTYTVSLRFGPAGATEQQLAGDIYARFACAFPRTVRPPLPNRPVAAVNMTSARFVNGVRTPYPTNPRGWWNSSTVDVTTPEGIAEFQGFLLGSADTTIAEMTRVGAMGAIFWDLEGQQYNSAYIGDPCQIEAIAPELKGVIDEFIAKFTAAGFAIGFCIRPQLFDAATDTQTNVRDPGGVMFTKMQYACDRWGATMFYIDSNLDYEGTLNPAAVFERLALALPGVQLFPEWETTRYYAYTIPYNNATNNLFGAPASALAVYRDAVGIVKVNDPAAADYPNQIAAAAMAGNILLFDGWYRHPANDLIQQIYEALNAPLAAADDDGDIESDGDNDSDEDY